MIDDPFLLLSFVRSITFFSYSFLSILKTKLNHVKLEKIYEKIIEVTQEVDFSQSALRKKAIEAIFQAIFVIGVNGYLFYVYIRVTEGTNEKFEVICMMVLMLTTRGAENVFGDLMNIICMFVSDAQGKIEKLGDAWTKEKVQPR